MNQKSFSLALKALAFLPLILFSAGAWYYFSGKGSGRLPEEAPAPAVAQAAAPAAEAPQAPRTAVTPPGTELAPGLLDMQGPDKFKAQVTAALKLIWSEDRETFLYIRDSLSLIRNENRTGYYYEGGKRVASISSDHAFRSVSWCAGIIAHQAWHARYEAAKRRRRGPPPPPGQSSSVQYDLNPKKLDYKSLSSILEMEDRAAAYQLQILRLVRAPRAETDLLLKRAPRDFSVSHDGNYSLKP